MHIWQTADVFVPLLQRPPSLDQHVPQPFQKLDLVGDLLQQIPRWIEPSRVRGPILEETIHPDGAEIVQLCGAGGNYPGHSVGQRILINFRLEDKLGVG